MLNICNIVNLGLSVFVLFKIHIEGSDDYFFYLSRDYFGFTSFFSLSFFALWIWNLTIWRKKDKKEQHIFLLIFLHSLYFPFYYFIVKKNNWLR